MWELLYTRATLEYVVMHKRVHVLSDAAASLKPPARPVCLFNVQAASAQRAAAGTYGPGAPRGGQPHHTGACRGFSRLCVVSSIGCC